jgi:flagellar biosynthesis/type III secretory pathway M-ring protein FliF/YscJ
VSLLYAAPALPLGQAGKFVAAAYGVFVVGILIYVAIMAVRAQRTERDLDQLQREVQEIQAAREAGDAPAADSVDDDVAQRTGSVQ